MDQKNQNDGWTLDAKDTPAPIDPTQKLITITEEEYKKLKEDVNFLRCLEAAGVDNWSGYSYACELYQDEDNPN